MRRRDYIRTRRAQVSALRMRRHRRFMVMIDQQPQGKKIKPVDAAAFRRAVLERLEKAGQAAYRGDVLLQMDFFSTSKDAPAIYSLPKKYIDLLWKHGRIPDHIRPRLLLHDDRQVRALVVRYHLRGLSGKPMVWLRAEPFRDFLADAQLVERIRQDDFEDGKRLSWHTSITDDLRDGPFRCEQGGADDGFLRLAELESERKSVLRGLSNDAFESMRQLTRMEAHRSHLQRAERHMCSGVLYAFQNTPTTKREPQDGFLDRLAFQTRNMSLAPPFTLELHHAPYRKGDGEAFDQALRAALDGYKATHHYVFPVAAVLNVTILVIPPEVVGIPSKDVRMDLDNLATRIVRQLHEIWAPPSSFAHAYNTDNIEDESIGSHWENARNELPKALKHSIAEYRAFELPRLPDDPKEGFVRLAVGDGVCPVRFREEIDEYLKKWEDTVDL